MPYYEKDSPRFRVLEVLMHGTVSMADVLNELVFIGTARGHGQNREAYKKLKMAATEQHAAVDRAIAELREQHKFKVIVSKLRTQGLITPVSRGRLLQLTSRGRAAFFSLLRKIDKKSHPPIPQTKYTTPRKSRRLTMVIFDIHERERWKRDWLRSVLHNFGFKKIQKSVWIGALQLPNEFLDDLRKLNLMSSVHIFSVLNTGTLNAYY